MLREIIKAANEQLGLPQDGSLPAQVDAIEAKMSGTGGATTNVPTSPGGGGLIARANAIRRKLKIETT
eukprot:CAMPEP_0206314578 /NCGR_PEP_ID=MMETSP0106_2-20121207/15089_1 /ASSEMBLY_ACC=CAM_ASM_000206 /TAXON_ID=81532 /ORGANISM="Acanthoeca-like sp., Strain 10tr" /LENGTH=67 /DNA_ID=CAMNT_0053745937 /DNA_START=1 /DNA_END=200 /DNA_ORIENTATION=+